MIGNDVVDLLQSRIESNWQRKGFLERLFVAHEQEMIQQAADREQMVWKLWSMKEATYKIYNRQTGIRAFIPLSFTCFVTDNAKGYVNCNGNRYHTLTHTDTNTIHTISVCNEQDFDLVYEPLLSTIIKDSNGLPYTTESNELTRPASISHHGAQLKIVALREL